MEELTWGRHIPDDLISRWPKDDSGEPEKPVFLCHCSPQNLNDEQKKALEAFAAATKESVRSGK